MLFLAALIGVNFTATDTVIMGKQKLAERQQAAELFINSTLTKEQVGAIVKVSAVQIGKWAKEDNWKLQRTAKQATAEQIITNYYMLIAEAQKTAIEEKRQLTSAEMDKLHKMADSIDKLKKKMNIGNYYMVLEEFTKELMQIDISASKVLAPYMMDFLNKKVKQLQNVA